MLMPQTHFPPSPSLPTRWTSCGHVQVAGKKSQIVKGYFRKSVGKKGTCGLLGCVAAIRPRSSTLFAQDFSERAIRSRSHDDAFDAPCEEGKTGRYGSSAVLADLSLWNMTMSTMTMMKMVITRPDIVSQVYKPSREASPPNVRDMLGELNERRERQCMD